MRNPRSRILIGILIAILAIGAFALVLNLIEKHGLIDDDQFGDTGDWGDDSGEQYLTIGNEIYRTTDDIDTYLLIGTDDMKNDSTLGYEGEMADFLALLLIDNTTEKYGFYQINRNTITPVTILDKQGEEAGTVEEQICISHWYGTTPEERNNNTLDTVSRFFGDLKIDGYYTLNMSDIGLVNDAIGGVVVDIDEDLTKLDPEFVKGSSVLLKGDQAEKFIRARKGIGKGLNQERMSRQRIYMQSAYDLLLGQLRENPEYVNDLYDQLSDTVVSSFEGRDLSTMANRIVKFDSQGIMTFDGENKTGDTLGDGKMLEEFYVDPASIVSNLKKVINLEIAPEDEEETDEGSEDIEEGDSDEYVLDAEDFEELDADDQAMGD